MTGTYSSVRFMSLQSGRENRLGGAAFMHTSNLPGEVHLLISVTKFRIRTQDAAKEKKVEDRGWDSHSNR